MRSSLVRVSAPVAEPVTLTDVREHLRVDDTDDDAQIERLIKAGREWAEGFTRRALITQSWRYSFDYFPRTIELPRPPLQSVTSIEYVDPGGVLQTLDPSLYTVHTDPVLGLVHPAYGELWPSTRREYDAVRVTFVAGFGDDPDSVEEEIKQGIRLHISRLFDNREPVVTGTIVNDQRSDEARLRPYQIGGF